MRGADPAPGRPEACTIPVHPHMRGADAESAAEIIGNSPVHPHMRGADNKRQQQACFAIRFTPTCVGQMTIYAVYTLKPCGSPPHAWGRFHFQGRKAFLYSVHPHMRGADEILEFFWCF